MMRLPSPWGTTRPPLEEALNGKSVCTIDERIAVATRSFPMAFAQLQLADPLARAVAEMGYESMTPIQAQAIPVVIRAAT
jgi:superfamily II DNA/RNA helicase